MGTGGVVLLGVLAAGVAAPAASTETSAREAVLATVQRFFDTMATRDVKGATAVLLPEGRIYSTRVLSGKAVVRSFAGSEYLDRLAGRKEEVLERIWEPDVRVRGGIATVWAPYDFWKDGTFSHCGVDAFDLVETDEGWKIAGGVYTVETEGCAPSPLGPPRFAGKAGEAPGGP